MSSVLYLSYDGLAEPLGRSQVLQYLERLAADHSIVLVTYEKPEHYGDEDVMQDLRVRTEACGLTWIALQYHKWPPVISTLWDVARGFFVSFRVVRHSKVTTVHARSYVMALIAHLLRKMFRTKFIFDIRGFYAEERVNAGTWKEGGAVFNVVKFLERRFFLSADTVVSLTHAAVDEIGARPYASRIAARFVVIPTCVNLDLFFPGDAKPSGFVQKPLTVACVGSVGGWFALDKVIEFYQLLRQASAGARLVFLNRGEHDLIHEACRESALESDAYEVREVEFEDVSSCMRLADLGLFFYKPALSELARSPTKLGEFLASGVPCVANRGVGDSEQVLTDRNVGVVASGLERECLAAACVDVLKLLSDRDELAARCRKVAEDVYSLDVGVNRYADIYHHLSRS